ncbi:hypothetical protein [Halalkalibacter wakoensis]|nr:hypothetical protein [Halalkalibacter wakoensis]
MTTQKSNNGNMYTLKKCEYLNEKGKKCGNAGIKLEYVEKHVILHLQTFKEEIMEAIKALDEKKFATNDKDCIHRLNRIENKIKEVKDEKKNLIDLAVAGIFTHKEVREKKQELEDLLLYLQREHKNLKDEINDKKAKTSDAQICGVLSKMSLSNIKDHSDLLNETLKLVIKKIYYSRKMPTDVSNKSTRNPERRNYPFQLVIEYY